jgi:hypothetical protein
VCILCPGPGGKPPAPYDQYRITVDGVLTFAKKNPAAPVYVGPGDLGQLRDRMLQPILAGCAAMARETRPRAHALHGCGVVAVS